MVEMVLNASVVTDTEYNRRYQRIQKPTIMWPKNQTDFESSKIEIFIKAGGVELRLYMDKLSSPFFINK